jgi:hypothetical protein
MAQHYIPVLLMSGSLFLTLQMIRLYHKYVIVIGLSIVMGIGGLIKFEEEEGDALRQ